MNELTDNMINQTKELFHNNEIMSDHQLMSYLGITTYTKMDIVLRELKEALIIQNAGGRFLKKFNPLESTTVDSCTSQINLF